MGKRGGKKHMKRIAVPQAIPLHDKKDHTWSIQGLPGPHPEEQSIPLGVLLREVMKVAKTAKEVKQILSKRLVEIDGKVRTEEKFPVGLMDVVSIPKSGKKYRIMVDRKGRLFPMEIKDDEASQKLVQVVKKHIIKGGKVNVTFHDGKNLLADNHIKVGDTLLVSLPVAKIEKHLKKEKGAHCLVVEGKHVGTLVKLKDVMQRKGGKPDEALVQPDEGAEFITVAKYLFVVSDDFKIKGEAA